MALEHLIFDIDELVGYGTIKLSTPTLEALELEYKETGHHVGNVSLIHSMRAATNEKLARDEAERRYMEEFGRPNPNAYEYYHALDNQPVLAADPGVDTAPESVPLPEHPEYTETPEHAYLREEAEHEG